MNTGGTSPTPERLAAYADGELNGPERAAVEEWLEVCPQARAEVDALRRLACQCRRTAATEPSADLWDAVLSNIHAAVPAGARPLRFPHPRRWPVVPAVAAAAALLAAIAVDQSFRSPAPIPPAPISANPAPSVAAVVPEERLETLNLADAREVDIISIDDHDTRFLLVGQAPIREPLQLAGPGDVTNVGVEPSQGVSPDSRLPGAPPIIVPSPTADAP